MGWADPDNWVGLGRPRSKMVRLISAQQISLFFFFWVGLDQNMFGPGLHGCLPNPTTMLINLLFARRTRSSTCNNKFCSGGEKVEWEESNLARWSSLWWGGPDDDWRGVAGRASRLWQREKEEEKGL